MPPGSGSNGADNNNDREKGNSVFSRGSGDNDKIVFYNRPNVGLKIWGPLVPASDYVPGLYSLTCIQTLFGLMMIKNVRKIWHLKTPVARFSKLLSTLASGYLIFNSGLEVSRLTLPYDPWYEEAKEARIRAQHEGKKVNFWFGPWDFKPMTFKEWNEKVDTWILKTEAEYSTEPDTKGSIQTQTSIDFSPASPMIHTAYVQARTANKQRNSEILEQLSNKDAFQKILPNYQTFPNFSIQRPHLNIPDDNNLEDNFDLDEVWELNDPWVGLGQDTDFVVRFIPKFRWIDKIQELNNQRLGNEQKLPSGQIQNTETGQKTEI